MIEESLCSAREINYFGKVVLDVTSAGIKQNLSHMNI